MTSDDEVQVLTGVGPTKLIQLFRHTANPQPSADDPPESIGDCYRTAIACLLGADRPSRVPHFAAMNLGETGGWEHYRLARLWLRAELELDLAIIDRADADRLDVAYLLSVRSKRGPWNHLVVARAGEVIHDPSANPDGYSIDDALDETADVLVQPYDPAPDEQVAGWRRVPADARP